MVLKYIMETLMFSFCFHSWRERKLAKVLHHHRHLNMTGLSEKQLKALAITPKLTAVPSMFFCVFIIKEVIADHRKGKGKATLRALLGMSVLDILATSGWFLSTWPAPRGSPNVVFAVGNTQSCTYQGFLLQIAIGAPMYNASLALYYLLTIRYGWQEKELRHIERWIHAFIITFAVGTGILMIPLNIYNYVGTVCWTMGLPQGCGHSNHTPSDVPCERGNHAWMFGLVFFYIPLWLCITFTSVAMALIYAAVRHTEKRSFRYVGAQLNRRHSFRHSKEIMIQALLYTAAFYVTWTPSTIWSIAHWFNKPMFWLDMLACICEPSQGSMNFFVYIRPRPALRNRLKRQLCCCFGWEQDSSSMLESSQRSYVETSRRSHDSRCEGEHHGDGKTVSFQTSLRSPQHETSRSDGALGGDKTISFQNATEENYVCDEAPETAENSATAEICVCEETPETAENSVEFEAL